MEGAEPTGGGQRLTRELFIRQLADRAHTHILAFAFFFVLFSFPRFPPGCGDAPCGRVGDVLMSARVQGKSSQTNLCSFSTTYRNRKQEPRSYLCLNQNRFRGPTGRDPHGPIQGRLYHQPAHLHSSDGRPMLLLF
ncbi:unnamed protein product [Arctogadus glacialis]